jgi:glycosyltransferase involved in cell wall biosynthesis
MRLSVLIFTHNPDRQILGRVIDGLRRQSLGVEEWELIVVDNASDEKVSNWLNLEWHKNARLLHEPAVGKTKAVFKGISSAVGDLLVFVDDDNFLEPDYLRKAIDIGERWPILGAWGGRILPEFETTPSEWTKRYWSYLTILDCSHDRWSNIPDHFEAIPPGAGLVVRRQVAQVYAELVRSDPTRMALDRTGKALISGGDTDLTFTACDLGFGVARFSSLELRHYMPQWRFEEDYLLRMVEGMAYSLQMLFAIRGKPSARRSIARRAWQYVTSWRLSQRDRRFWHAQLRGKARAERTIASHPELRFPRDIQKLAREAACRVGVKPICTHISSTDDSVVDVRVTKPIHELAQVN